MNDSNIFLPGSNKQIKIFFENVDLESKTILVAGTSSEIIANRISKKNCSSVYLIVEDYESFLNSQFILKGNEKVRTGIMEFISTDFSDNSFDLIYAQGSVSSINRNKIVKEFKRIAKPGCFFCIGEIVKLRNEIPTVIKNLFESSEMNPLFIEDLDEYYTKLKFDIVLSEDISDSLLDYYEKVDKKLSSFKQDLTEKEAIIYKKLLKKISHERNLYLSHGGDRYIGMKVLLLKQTGINEQT